MNNTPNINLSTYTSDPNDKFNLLVTFNNNMNKIDQAIGSQNDQIDVIEETASTAVTTANTAVTTATEALSTADSKTSVNDNVASATTTYSSNKINELISGIQPGAEIDDTVTSTTKTWSSSKINTELSSANTFPNYNRDIVLASTSEVSSGEMELTYTTTEDCYIYAQYTLATGASGRIITNIGRFNDFIVYQNQSSSTGTGRLFKVKANTEITIQVYGVTGDTHILWLKKLEIV
jgi:hypothetical protein